MIYFYKNKWWTTKEALEQGICFIPVYDMNTTLVELVVNDNGNLTTYDKDSDVFKYIMSVNFDI